MPESRSLWAFGAQPSPAPQEHPQGWLCPPHRVLGLVFYLEKEGLLRVGGTLDKDPGIGERDVGARPHPPLQEPHPLFQGWRRGKH